MIRCVRLSLAILAAGVALLLAGCAAQQPAGAWTLPYGGDSEVSIAPGGARGIVVFGDSLVHFSGPGGASGIQLYANEFRSQLNLSTVVAAAGGSSYSHWISPSLIGSVGLSTIADTVNYWNPRLVVLALGTNDARILSEESTNQFGYKFDDFAGAFESALNGSLAKAQCVVITTVTTHPPVNGGLAWQASTLLNPHMKFASFANPRVRLADWDAYSNGHPDWFDPDGLHHSDASGKAAYRNFLIDTVRQALNSGC